MIRDKNDHLEIFSPPCRREPKVLNYVSQDSSSFMKVPKNYSYLPKNTLMTRF